MQYKNFLKLLALTLLVSGAMLLGGCGDTADKNNQKISIVTSFYPMYLDVINITQGIEGVEVKNLTQPQTGCLHDYQLTTEDMKTLSEADILVVNGAGMENFLEKVAKENKNLQIIEAAATDKITFIEDEHGEINPHVWMSVTYAKWQVEAITFKLCELDPTHDKEYRKNALDYVNKLDALREEMHSKLDNLPHKDIVTFHEAFPYFAKEFKLNIVGVIEGEPGTEPTPKELEDIIAKVRAHPTCALFTEPQYSPKAAEAIARETGAAIYSLDPVVTGESLPENRDAYLKTMEQNAEVLVKALQ